MDSNSEQAVEPSTPYDETFINLPVNVSPVRTVLEKTSDGGHCQTQDRPACSAAAEARFSIRFPWGNSDDRT